MILLPLLLLAASACLGAYSPQRVPVLLLRGGVQILEPNLGIISRNRLPLSPMAHYPVNIIPAPSSYLTPPGVLHISKPFSAVTEEVAYPPSASSEGITYTYSQELTPAISHQQILYPPAAIHLEVVHPPSVIQSQEKPSKETAPSYGLPSSTLQQENGFRPPIVVQEQGIYPPAQLSQNEHGVQARPPTDQYEVPNKTLELSPFPSPPNTFQEHYPPAGNPFPNQQNVNSQTQSSQLSSNGFNSQFTGTVGVSQQASYSPPLNQQSTQSSTGSEQSSGVAYSPVAAPQQEYGLPLPASLLGLKLRILQSVKGASVFN